MTLPQAPTSAASPLVLLHGWGLHAGIWVDISASLATHHPLSMPDLPGYGTCPSVTPYTLAQLADAVAATTPQPAIWLGWSLGGLVALTVALRHPQRVRKLVLVATTPKFVQAADWACALPETVFAQFAAELAQDYPATVQRFLSLQVNANERATLRALRAAVAAAPAPAVAVLDAGLVLLRTTDLRAQLGALTLPVQIVHGDRDKLASIDAARYLATALPHATLVTLAGAGHAPFLSHPALFSEHILRFTADER